jgi:DNA-binding SARP family transcriptional activator
VVTRFGILGPVEVEVDGVPVLLRGAKRRALLIRLLISANQPVGIDTLADGLWDGSSGEWTGSTLASHISLLRKLIGPERIFNQMGSYCLTVEPGELDAHMFEAEVAAGRHALQTTDFGLAAEHFASALGHWRGRALADVEGAHWALAEVARLDELRLSAEESLLDARMALGQHRDVVGSAESAVDSQPLREHRWATLMLALYRSGRQADALRAYQRVRELLSQQVGLEPSAELRALETAIVQHSLDLDAMHTSSVPRAAVSAPPLTATPAETEALSATATLLFTDWVDSTAVSNSTDVDEADALRRAHFAMLRNALTQHGGMEVKNLGDGLMVVFSSPSQAIAAAVAMQQGAERLNRRSAVALELRVGLSAGEVVLEDGDYFGDSVVEAARLCALAAGGEVLLASLVRTLAGRRSQHTFTDQGALELKGIPDPVPALSLEWEPLGADASVIPLPEALRAEGPGFFGRASQQDQLSRLFDHAAGGQRQFVFLGGEPGIGKTTLTAVFGRSVGAAGGTVLYGRCPEHVSVPYQPFVESLEAYVHHAPQEHLDAHVREYGGELHRLVPALERRVPGLPPPTQSDPDTERYLAFGAAIGLLTEESSHRPVLLVLDDLHWAEPSTLQLLRHLGSTSPSLPLMVLGTYRFNEVTDDHPLAEVLAAFWRVGGVTRIDLEGLSPDEVLDLCAAAAGHEVEDEESTAFVRALQRDTSGNPYFVWQLLRHLAESGGIVQDDAARWSPDRTLLQSGLPASVHEVIAQRVRHLGPQASRVLSAASVIGAEFDLATLGVVCDITDAALFDVIEAAERSSLVQPADDGAYAFSHALLRNTLYDAMHSARRRQLHAAVARALEVRSAGPPSPAVLAHHFLAAGERSPALHYAELAGRDALTSMAPDEAVRWFGEAVSLLEGLQPQGESRRCDLTTQMGIAQRLAGNPGYRETLLKAVALADAAGDARRMAQAALANNRGFYSAVGAVDEERVAALHSTIDRLGGADAELKIRLMATLCSELVFGAPLPERRRLVGQVKDELALADPVTFVQVSNLLGEVARHPTDIEDRLEDTAVVLEVAESLSDPATLFWSIGHRMRATMEAGRVPEARELFARMVTLAEELSQPVMRWMTSYGKVQWAFLHGETEAGEEMAEEAMHLGLALGQPDAFIFYTGQLSHARWQQGRLVEIVDLIEEGARNAPGIPAYRAALARALGQAGRTEDAVYLLDEEAGHRFSDVPEDFMWTYGLVCYAEASMLTEHAASAAILYEMLEPFGGLLVNTGTTCEGPVAGYLAGLSRVVGEPDRAEQHLKEADRLTEVTGSPFFAARTLIERGRVAALRHDDAAARHFLEAGKTLATTWHFDGEVRLADAVFDTLG